MPYPTLRPSDRNYTPGDWGIKKFNAASGAEIRLRYGDKRFGAKFALQYKNVPDANAALFLEHYNETLGTYRKFTLPTQVLAGWNGTNYIPNTSEMQFRYEGPPEVQSVRPGVSTVSVTLLGVV
jgi:hypothetical protein